MSVSTSMEEEFRTQSGEAARGPAVLITGGHGFLGQYVVRALLEEFPRAVITILDKQGPAVDLFGMSDRPEISTVLADITSYTAIESAFAGKDAVIHLAGLVTTSRKDRKSLLAVNVEGTLNILRAIAVHHVLRLVHVSSVAAVGYNGNGAQPVDEDFAFDWRIARRRKKFYMLTKHLADEAVLQRMEEGLDAVVLHPSLMFGPGDLSNSARFIRAMQQGRIAFNMPGGMSVMHVRDAAEGIRAVMKNGVRRGRYLLSGDNHTFRDINRITAEGLGVRPPRWNVPRAAGPFLYRLARFLEAASPKKIELSAEDVDNLFKFRYCDNSRARKDLQWRPSVSFPETIRETVDWLKTHGLLDG